MIRIYSLFWTLLVAVFITGLSFFYIRGDLRGFPFTFSKQVIYQVDGNRFEFNVWSAALDVIFWWLIFSILWIILKNYIFEA